MTRLAQAANREVTHQLSKAFASHRLLSSVTKRPENIANRIGRPHRLAVVGQRDRLLALVPPGTGAFS